MSNNRTGGVTRGFSLIEFMIAILLGTILISGAVSVYLASKRSYVEVEQVGGLSENGRFALQILKDSLLHVGFFGPSRPGDFTEDTNLGAVANDCTGIAKAYDLGLGNTFFSARTTTADPGTAFGCITDAVTNSGILVVKYLVPSPTYDSDPEDPNAPTNGVLDFPAALSGEETYAVVNSEYGLLLDGADSAPDVAEGEQFARGVAWPYRFEIYYVRKVPVGSSFMPTLSRKTLSWNGAAMAVVTEDLVEGVELFYLRFGVTDTATGEVEGYTSITDLDTSGGLELFGATKNWGQVDSIEAFVLVRSATEDPLYTDSKTYNMGDVPITPSTDANYPVNVRRLMMQSNISLRNPKLVIRGGA